MYEMVKLTLAKFANTGQTHLYENTYFRHTPQTGLARVAKKIQKKRVNGITRTALAVKNRRLMLP
jgi:hypothetical protein